MSKQKTVITDAHYNEISLTLKAYMVVEELIRNNREPLTPRHCRERAISWSALQLIAADRAAQNRLTSYSEAPKALPSDVPARRGRKAKVQTPPAAEESTTVPTV